MFKIGHSAYTGPNSLAHAGTKSEALAILRAKGVKRDAARAAITLCLSKDFGSTVVMGGPTGANPIELVSTVQAVEPIRGEKARQIINRNAKKALEIFHRLKDVGAKPSPTWVATRILMDRVMS